MSTSQGFLGTVPIDIIYGKDIAKTLLKCELTIEQMSALFCLKFLLSTLLKSVMSVFGAVVTPTAAVASW